MKYNLHTTTKRERDAALATPGILTTLDPAQLHGPGSWVWEEESGEWRDHDEVVRDFHALLRSIDADPSYGYRESAYFKRYLKDAHAHGIFTRLDRLPALLADIRANGVREPVHVEVTGQRLDGSYRTKIAMYLGIGSVPAMVHRFRREDVTPELLERLIQARHRATPVDYYEFPYSFRGWSNVPPQANPVYRENAERAKVIVPLIQGENVLDLGCNEGYISLVAARAGHSVVGVEADGSLIGPANLNRLVLEHAGKGDLLAEFVEGDIVRVPTPYIAQADTVLLLNVLYHLPREAQEPLLRSCAGKQVIFQCNLRKEAERARYYTSHPDDLEALLRKVGRTFERIEHGDKPIYVSNL